MLTPYEKKIIMRAMLKEVIVLVSMCAKQRIKTITETKIGVEDFSTQICEDTQGRLGTRGNGQLLERSKLQDIDPFRTIWTILKNMRIAYANFKDFVPTLANLHRLHFKTNNGKSKEPRASAWSSWTLSLFPSKCFFPKLLLLSPLRGKILRQ